METIIGLIPNTNAKSNTRHELEKAGFSENEVSILSQPIDAWRRLRGWQKVWTVLKRTAVGAVFGLMLYAIFGDHIDISICNSMNFSLITCYFSWLLASQNWIIVFGTLGAILGLNFLLQDIYPYLKGVRGGKFLFLIETSEGNSKDATRILQQGQGSLIHNMDW